MNEILVNPDKLCRICLRDDEEFQSIFEENLWKLLEEVVTSFKVKSPIRNKTFFIIIIIVIITYNILF